MQAKDKTGPTLLGMDADFWEAVKEECSQEEARSIVRVLLQFSNPYDKADKADNVDRGNQICQNRKSNDRKRHRGSTSGRTLQPS